MEEAMIWLLDLNHTLVANSGQAGVPYHPDLPRELYRGWLVEQLREEGGPVLLITWRHRRYEAATLQRIAEQCDGWAPTGVF